MTPPDTPAPSTPSSRRTITTACTLDCPDSCSLEIEVEGDRIRSIDAGRANPLTAGFICSKVKRFDDLVHHESRVQQPLRRTGTKGSGQFEPISWDQALDLIVAEFRRARDTHGGESILPLSYGGSNGLLTQDTTDARLWRRLGASRLLRTVCAAPSSAAARGLYGNMPGCDLRDIEHSRLIVLWGVNPSVTGIHLVPIVQRAQAAGAKLIVVDPRRTPLAKKADLHLAPRPGTDLVLALALIQWLKEHDRVDRDFLAAHTQNADALLGRAEGWTLSEAAEVTGLDAESIAEFARLYAEGDPALIRCGWGVERNRNGGSAVAAILALPAVAGKFGVRGGGFTMSNSGAWKGDPRFGDAVLEAEPPTRPINMNHAGRVLLDADPAVRVLFVYNCNPLATLPEQNLMRRGLEREDLFTVVFDPVMTDTAQYADIVLPATTFVEHEDLAKGYGAVILHRSRPVVAPVGEARPNVLVFSELLRRLELARPDEPSTAEELRTALLGDDAAQIESEGSYLSPAVGDRAIPFQDAWPTTPSGRVDLCPDALDREAPKGLYAFQDDPGTDAFPLALLSPATHRAINSTMGQVRALQTVLEIHPEDAKARGLDGTADGDLVRVFNEHGEVICPLRLNADLRPGVVTMPKGCWSRSSRNGATSNALVPDRLTDLAGGAVFNDARVQVESYSPSRLVP